MSLRRSYSSVRDHLCSFASPGLRVVRVGQLDAELLDQELSRLLCQPLQKALGLANTALRARFDPELTLFVQLILYKFSLWDLGASYGARLQGLKCSAPGVSSDPISPGGLPRRTLVIHGVLTIVVPYLHGRLRAHALSCAWPDTPSSDTRRRAWQLLTRLESTHSLLSMLNFVVFLLSGRFRSLSDRLLGISLVPTSSRVRREVSYEFMNRQMVWHAFTEFLLFLLPLVNTRSVRRRITRVISRLALPTTFSNSSRAAIRSSLRKHGKYEALAENQCAICCENASHTFDLGYSVDAVAEAVSEATRDDQARPFPIYIPYTTSCGHVYCYHCIAERMMRTADEGQESGWECLRCAEKVRSADRLGVETSIRGQSDGTSDYEFSSSDLDVSGTSASSSYSWNE